MNFLTNLPDQEELLDLFPHMGILNVNAHIHTPYSFSAFDDIASVFEMANKEKIAVAGINDFFVTDGFDEFYNKAVKSGVFPLFNIEFIGLLKKEQESGIRINDPNNAGRCYFCGKGLNYPFTVDPGSMEKLNRIKALSQDQIRAMIEKLNALFATLNCDIILDYNKIRAEYAMNLVRERHLAKAVRIALTEKYADKETFVALLTKLFGGKAPKSSTADIPGLENEIRANLLKSGGKAFVEEDEASFLNINEIKEIIINAGGIPCYPMLLDDKNGNHTEFERTPVGLCNELISCNIGCIEVIPGRNDSVNLERYVYFFHNKGFVILFGTEHNTPDLIPLTCDTRGNEPLSPLMKQISYEGACVVAAHQYLKAKGKQGFMDRQGNPLNDRKSYFVKLGDAVIHYFLTMQKQKP